MNAMYCLWNLLSLALMTWAAFPVTQQGVIGNLLVPVAGRLGGLCADSHARSADGLYDSRRHLLRGGMSGRAFILSPNFSRCDNEVTSLAMR